MALPISRAFEWLGRAAQPGLGGSFMRGMWGGATSPFRSDIPGMLERAAIGDVVGARGMIGRGRTMLQNRTGGMRMSAVGSGYLRAARASRFGVGGAEGLMGMGESALDIAFRRGGGAGLAARQTSAMIGAGVGLLGVAKLASSITGISPLGMAAFAGGHFYGTKGWMGAKTRGIAGIKNRGLGGTGFLAGGGAAIGAGFLF